MVHSLSKALPTSPGRTLKVRERNPVHTKEEKGRQVLGCGLKTVGFKGRFTGHASAHPVQRGLQEDVSMFPLH